MTEIDNYQPNEDDPAQRIVNARVYEQRAVRADIQQMLEAPGVTLPQPGQVDRIAFLLADYADETSALSTHRGSILAFDPEFGEQEASLFLIELTGQNDPNETYSEWVGSMDRIADDEPRVSDTINLQEDQLIRLQTQLLFNMLGSHTLLHSRWIEARLVDEVNNDHEVVNKLVSPRAIYLGRLPQI